ncbi:MAG: cell division protein ZapE [Legionellaceae bacterium]|nr:cell division protein ZapE [Legionellaceae bacterium]HCA90121.1 cell division protein ZapE [Legionellales bacterium]|tara:strand:+ start:99 stop:1175 length:1077 start_codon:yes stop_codon:yes gene_type:complete
MTTLPDYYQQAIQNHDIRYDAAQLPILIALEKLRGQLTQIWRRPRWLGGKPIQGVYIHGAVGRGKTFLMDMFYEKTHLVQKKRYHFHYFMQQIDLKLRKKQGHINPIQLIAYEFSQTTKLLCLDEFMVDDVAYAMILSDLLQALFSYGVVLVATSNTLPDDLYPNGVQRARFLPAIQAIKHFCAVLTLAATHDYRLNRPKSYSAYLTPFSCATTKTMLRFFHHQAPKPSQRKKTIEIQKRAIDYLRRASHIIWFDFASLCALPRCQLDYLELANQFAFIMVSGIPQLDDRQITSVLLLMHLVDVAYDQGVQLVVSAAVELDALYVEGRLMKAFRRTKSRLYEMQSAAYQARVELRCLT